MVSAFPGKIRGGDWGIPKTGGSKFIQKRKKEKCTSTQERYVFGKKR